MNPSAHVQIWEAALGSLQVQVSRPIYATWLKDTVGLSISDGRVVVGTPSAFVAEWLERRMSSLVETTLSQVLGQPTEVQFQVMAEGAAPQRSLPSGPQTSALEPPSPSNGQPYSNGHSAHRLNPRYTLDSFVVGASNHLAYAAALAVSSRPGEAYNPLFLYAGVGLGKTHLLHAIGHAAALKGLTYLYVSAEQFTNDLVTSIQTKRTGDFRKKYRTVDVLLMDDVQFLRGKQGIQEGFFHTFNELHNANRQIVITSDRPSGELAPLEDRLRSRFAWGLSADIQPPNEETRLAILQAKAQWMGASVPSEVLELIAVSFPCHVRDLEGALNRVVAYADLTQQRLTPELATNALADLIQKKQQEPPAPARVISQVCSFYGITPEALTSKRRDKGVTLPRHVAIYLLRELSQASLTTIGTLLGGRNHATIRHAWAKISQVKHTDTSLQAALTTLQEALIQEVATT